MSLPGVVAVGEGERDGQSCIRIFATESTPELLKKLPAEIDGIAVVLDISEEIKGRKASRDLP